MLDFWLVCPMCSTHGKVGDVILLTNAQGTGLAEQFRGSKHLPLQHDNLSSIPRTLVKGKNQPPQLSIAVINIMTKISVGGKVPFGLHPLIISHH